MGQHGHKVEGSVLRIHTVSEVVEVSHTIVVGTGSKAIRMAILILDHTFSRASIGFLREGQQTLALSLLPREIDKALDAVATVVDDNI